MKLPPCEDCEKEQPIGTWTFLDAIQEYEECRSQVMSHVLFLAFVTLKKICIPFSIF